MYKKETPCGIDKIHILVLVMLSVLHYCPSCIIYLRSLFCCCPNTFTSLLPGDTFHQPYFIHSSKNYFKQKLFFQPAVLSPNFIYLFI